jgi:hypothetical protein
VRLVGVFGLADEADAGGGEEVGIAELDAHLG